jgi:hypothetical protein
MAVWLYQTFGGCISVATQESGLFIPGARAGFSRTLFDDSVTLYHLKNAGLFRDLCVDGLLDGCCRRRKEGRERQIRPIGTLPYKNTDAEGVILILTPYHVTNRITCTVLQGDD